MSSWLSGNEVVVGSFPWGEWIALFTYFWVFLAAVYMVRQTEEKTWASEFERGRPTKSQVSALFAVIVGTIGWVVGSGLWGLMVKVLSGKPDAIFLWWVFNSGPYVLAAGYAVAKSTERAE